MKKHWIIPAMALLLTLLAVSMQAQSDPFADPGENARSITACILATVQDITPYIVLAFLVIAGIIHITAAEDTKQRLLAKKYMTFAVIGFICVQVLVLIAASPPFNVSPEQCIRTGVTDPFPDPSHDAELINPGDDETLTESN